MPGSKLLLLLVGAVGEASGATARVVYQDDEP